MYQLLYVLINECSVVLMSDRFCLDIRSPTERLIFYANPSHSSISQHLFHLVMLTEQLFCTRLTNQAGCKRGVDRWARSCRSSHTPLSYSFCHQSFSLSQRTLFCPLSEVVVTHAPYDYSQL